MLKKILAFLMVATLFGALIGCATDDPIPGPDEGTEGQQDAGTDDPPADPPDADSEFENVTIVYACPQVLEGFNYNTDCEYAVWILNKFNITFEGVNLP